MTPDFPTLAFLGFAATAAIAALATITARNPVHAALWLVLTFFSVACTWIIGGAEFLGVALVLVYVGAVMVLFLFVVMMLDINIERVRQGFWKNLPIGALVGGLMVAEMALVLSGRYFSPANLPPHNLPADYSNTKELARVLYTEYAYPFEIASVILLVAIIAAVMLTLRRRKDNKAMHSADQIAVKAADRMRLVKMTPEVELPSAGKGEQP